jgi:hypothetical protein
VEKKRKVLRILTNTRLYSSPAMKPSPEASSNFKRYDNYYMNFNYLLMLQRKRQSLNVLGRLINGKPSIIKSHSVLDPRGNSIADI